MKKATKRLVNLLVFIAGLFIITILLTGKHALDVVFRGACGNELLHSIPSPDEERTAYIFKRDCGATTDYSYQLTILKADEEFQNESGNAFISEKSFTAKWTDERHLEVEYAPYADTHMMDRRVRGVQIEYLAIVE